MEKSFVPNQILNTSNVSDSKSVNTSYQNMNIFNDENSESHDHDTNEPSTYLCIGNEQDGKLEIDLIQFREKNVSMRYLSFTFSGINPKTGQVQSAFLNVDNKEAFETIKKFFAQLDWNS